ncbi:MAG: MoaD/ThiS family protein [Betaproteobacteria bacterium]|nr:MoaD/ThiS family protein [Betaproteobacteria bacterium]
MKIELLYFGRPGERLKISRETADVPEGLSTLAALLAWLRLRGGKWERELADDHVRCAINQEFSGLTASISEYDEIAIFSLISGG